MSRGGVRRDEAWLARHQASRGELAPRKPAPAPPPAATKGAYPLFEALLRDAGLAFCAEYRFDGTRLWRFDYAWPEQRVALEVEGGAFAKGGGGHNRGAGFQADMEKYNAAALLGWVVLRYPPEKLAAAIPALVQVLRGTRPP